LLGVWGSFLCVGPPGTDAATDFSAAAGDRQDGSVP
jgi:hypothetical protein